MNDRRSIRYRMGLKREVYKKQNPEVCLTTGTTGDYFANIRDFSYICK